MTVCVAAIARFTDDDGSDKEVIVLASDRMITARRIREYELAEQTKVVWHKHNIALMMSGSLDVLWEVYRNTVKAIGETEDLDRFVTTLANQMQSARRQQIERQYFEPYNLTIDDFLKRQKEWLPDFWERMQAHINDTDEDIGEVIVAGFDTDGAARLFTIEGAGWERPWTGTGFCAVGIGAEHAEAEFTHANYSPKRTWHEAVYITYFAKKRGEEAPGVGDVTDLWHIVDNGYFYFPPLSKTNMLLSEMYRNWRQFEVAQPGLNTLKVGQAMGEDYGAAAAAQKPRQATEEERRAAEAKAEEGDIAIPPDEKDIRGGSPEGEPEG